MGAIFYRKMNLNTFFEQNKIELAGKTLVVAASGGPDSIALVDMLDRIKDKSKFQLVVAHFDHQLRADSYLETELLKRYCQLHNLQLVNEKWAKQNHPQNGIEAAARTTRYAFLTKTVKKCHSDYLLTAHHGDDLLENILLKFIRSGNPLEMNSLQAISQMHGIPLLRPLFTYSKKDLIAYDQKRHLQFITDETNAEDDVLRNRIRHHVVPFLKKENSHLLDNAVCFLQEMNTISDLAQEALKDIGQPESFLTYAYRLPHQKLAQLSEQEKRMYWRQFIWHQWHQRVNPHLANFNLTSYQNYDYLWRDLPKVDEDLSRVKVEQIFTYRNEKFVISSHKNKQLIGSFWSVATDFYVGSLPPGSKLPLKNGQHAKAKKMFAQSQIPAELRPLCLTIFDDEKKPIFIEKTFQEQSFIPNARQYFVYHLKKQ